MVLTFANGGPPGGNNKYAGVTYGNGTALLTQIQSTLTTAGWTTQSGSPGSGVMLMRGSSGGDFCYIEFSITGGSSQFCEIRGSDDAVKTNLSTLNLLKFEFDPVGTNTLFITADDYAGVIASFPDSGVLNECVHFGFLDREDATDSTAIMIGRVCTIIDHTTYTNTLPDNRTANAYFSACFQQGLEDTSFWPILGLGFGAKSTTQNTRVDTAGHYPLHTTYDKVVVARSGASLSQESTTNANTSYHAYDGGANNFDSLPHLVPYYYLDSLAADNQYGTGTNRDSAAINFPYRGSVAFAATGFSSYAANTQWNMNSGDVYLTVGPNWQGIRIA